MTNGWSLRLRTAAAGAGRPYPAIAREYMEKR
jgi:hypothetical protein